MRDEPGDYIGEKRMTPKDFERLYALAAGIFKKKAPGRERKPDYRRDIAKDKKIRSEVEGFRRKKEQPIKRDSLYFVVFGKPVGYYSHGAKPNWKRRNSYYEYLEHVRDTAKVSGIKLPLIATNTNPVYIHTVTYFENGVHADPENVRKGISDALFYEKGFKGIGDKHCGGSFKHPLYDKENPRVEITIEYLYTGNE